MPNSAWGQSWGNSWGASWNSAIGSYVFDRWGTSWRGTWGNSWKRLGSIVVPPTPETSLGGGGAGRKKDNIGINRRNVWHDIKEMEDRVIALYRQADQEDAKLHKALTRRVSPVADPKFPMLKDAEAEIEAIVRRKEKFIRMAQHEIAKAKKARAVIDMEDEELILTLIF